MHGWKKNYFYLAQTCSRVLLPMEERKPFIDRLSSPTLSILARKKLAKKINEKCRKIGFCPYCTAVNGVCCVCACMCERGREGKEGKGGREREMFIILSKRCLKWEWVREWG